MNSKQDEEWPRFEELATKQESSSSDQEGLRKTQSNKNAGKNVPKMKDGAAQGQKKQTKKEREIANVERLRGEFYMRSKEYWKDLKKLGIQDDSALNYEISVGGDAIEVLDKKGRPFVQSIPFSRRETWERFHRVVKRKGYKKVPRKELPINAMDKHEKTIAIRIYLNKKKEDIIQEIKYLLEILDWEAKYFRVDLQRMRPRLDVFQKALQVNDLRQVQKLEGKTSWKQIAQCLYDDVDIDVAISKARHHYDIALRMINGGWMDL